MIAETLQNNLYTFEDLQTLNENRNELQKFITNGRLEFNQNTTSIRFASFPQNKEIKEVVFTCPQPNLEYLDLSGCAINQIDIPQGCTNLRTIFLHICKLTQISFKGDLPNLELLDLSENQLKEIKLDHQFNKLRFLYLNNNQLSDLSNLSHFFLRENFDFHIANNPLINPSEALVEQGKLAVVKHFQGIDKYGTDYLYEAKLLILGEPGAGKTSLARKIINPESELPKEDESTEGIDVMIHNYNFQNKDYRLNIWDFAGQEIYSATHRFFLTNRSLYVILADSRKDNTDFFYWLNTLEIFGGTSPAIILINKKDDRNKDFGYNTYRRRFKNLKEKYEVNLIRTDKAFDSLINGIQYHVSTLPHIGEPISGVWIKIREKIEELENQGTKTISLKEYRKICNDLNYNDIQGQDVLSAYFHDLGIFLYFNDKNDKDKEEYTILKKTIFINKEWILNAAYLVIDSKELQQQKGKFTKENVENWLGAEYHDFIDEILAIMSKFYLIYAQDGFFIAPQKLPSEIHSDHKLENSLNFIFEYEDFMPVGILWQFIVEMNDAIYEENVWKYGVILDKEKDTFAEVTEVRDKKQIIIKVSGTYRVDYRAEIIAKIEDINKQYGEKLKVEKKVPCVCEECIKSEDPEYHKYDVLIKYKNSGETVKKCDKSLKDANIEKMLSGINFEKEKESLENKPTEKSSKEKKPRKYIWLKVIFSIVLIAGVVVVYLKFPEYWKFLTPIGLVIIGVIAFLDKFFSFLGKIFK